MTNTSSLRPVAHSPLALGASIAVFAATLTACTHTVRIEPSPEPIKIDLNVKIDQEVRVRLEREIEDMIANNPDIF